MSASRVYSVTLRLIDIHHLFETPELSPFSDAYQEYSYISGIEFVADELYADTSYDKVHLTVALPPEQIVPGLDERVGAAIKRYARGRIKDVEHDLRAMLWRGRRALLAALVAVAVFMGIAALTGSDRGFVLQTITDALIIAAWVALWFPLETLFFDVWEYRLDRKIYRLLHDMDVTIVPDTGG